MKTTDFENFKISMNLNIEVDSSLRRITEMIKIIAQHRDPELMRCVVDYLSRTNENITNLIEDNICSDECKEE